MHEQVAIEIGERAWRAVPVEIDRARAVDHHQLTDPLRDQLRRPQGPDPDHAVETLADHLDPAIRGTELDLEVRIGRE